MNDMLNDALAFQRYHEDVKRGETNEPQRSASAAQDNGPRTRLAVTLVSLAARLQPNLTITVQQPAHRLRLANGHDLNAGPHDLTRSRAAAGGAPGRLDRSRR